MGILTVTIDEKVITEIITKAVDVAITKERQKQEEVDLIDGDTLCEKFGITKPTLQKWRDRNEITFVKIGDVIRYDLNQIVKEKQTKRRR